MHRTLVLNNIWQHPLKLEFLLVCHGYKKSYFLKSRVCYIYELAVILNHRYMGFFDFFKKEVKIEISLNTSVFTTKKIMIENELITRIYHSSDNYLSFMDDYSTNSNENIMIVSLGNILKKDNSIKAVINIPIGHCAYRTNLNNKWTIEKYVEEDDDD